MIQIVKELQFLTRLTRWKQIRENQGKSPNLGGNDQERKWYLN